MSYHREKHFADSGGFWFGMVATALVVIILCLAGCPQYNVYRSQLDGLAQLKQAEGNRQIAVQEAQAKMESAKLLAQAEVERAKGVAQANQIIAETLKNNEAYLRYLWITEVAHNQQGKTVVYVPTEANIPILEAGHRPDLE